MVDSKVNEMPPRNECLFHWVTVSSVRMRTLFDAIHNVITEAVLILDEDCVALDRYDNTQTMVVIVKLDRLDSGTYYCQRRLEVGLDVAMFHKTLNAVVQNDVLGLCITRESWENGNRTIDLYIMNETDMYCYAYKCRALAIDYEKVDLPKKSSFNIQIQIGCTNFKRYLHDCAEQGDFIKFKSVYNKKKQLIETILSPSGGTLRVSELKLILFSAVPDDFDEKRINYDDNQEYSIASLSLFTKATTLCKDVVVLIAENFPLVVQYDVGDLGVLRFLLAPRVSEDDLNMWDDMWDEQLEDVAPILNTMNEQIVPEITATELSANLGQSGKKRKRLNSEG